MQNLVNSGMVDFVSLREREVTREKKEYKINFVRHVLAQIVFCVSHCEREGLVNLYGVM